MTLSTEEPGFCNDGSSLSYDNLKIKLSVVIRFFSHFGQVPKLTTEHHIKNSQMLIKHMPEVSVLPSQLWQPLLWSGPEGPLASSLNVSAGIV